MDQHNAPEWSAQGAPGPTRQPAPPQNPPDTGNGSRRWVIALGVVVVLLALGGAWVLFNGDDPHADDGKAGSSEAGSSGSPSSDALAEQLVKAFTLTAGEARCVLDRARDHMSDDRISELIANPEPANQDVLDDTITACSLSEPTTDKPTETTKGGPSTYGDDPELDKLWDRCSKEGTAVCDELFNKAPEGSEYEAFADTCGGRGAPQVACAPDALAEPGSNPENQAGPSDAYGDNAELDRLWDDCEQGDPQACLTLAFQAPAGSEYAEFGASCGNRPDDNRCKPPD